MINAELVHAFPYQEYAKRDGKDCFDGVSCGRVLSSTGTSTIVLAMQFLVTKPLEASRIWLRTEVTDASHRNLLEEIIQLNPPAQAYQHADCWIWGWTHSFSVPITHTGPLHFNFYLAESSKGPFPTCHGKTIVYMSKE